ncbi:hypothetical protein ACHAWF_015784 [Thalassiosira exigua]
MVGRSASGKSTLLRLLSGTELPTDGYVCINGHTLDEVGNVGEMKGSPFWAKMASPPPMGPSQDGPCRVQPVILQGKPDFDDKLSVMERIVQTGLVTLQRCNKQGRLLEEESARDVLRCIAHDFASLLTLSKEQCNSIPSELSPSGEFLFCIACGCMMSVAPSIATQDAYRFDILVENGMYYPILFLDELFDAEHPNTVEKCGRGLLNLIRSGAVVVSATHRPEYFDGLSSRTVTFSGGKVLF